VGRTTTKSWKNALNRAGISDFRWHDLRHTWASWHVQKGTSLQELMELGGWSSFEMVLRYADLAGEHLKQAAGHIEGTVLAQSSETRRLRVVVSNCQYVVARGRIELPTRGFSVRCSTN